MGAYQKNKLDCVSMHESSVMQVGRNFLAATPNPHEFMPIRDGRRLASTCGVLAEWLQYGAEKNSGYGIGALAKITG